MQDKILPLLLILGLNCLTFYLNALVWFKYQRYEALVKKASIFTKKLGIPFASFFSSFVTKPNYKWFARSVCLFFLFLTLLPVILLLLFYEEF